MTTMPPPLFERDQLAMTNTEVARLTRPERADRIRALVVESHAIFDAAVAEHIDADSRTLAAVVGLFSGGNDSTTLMHLFRDRLTHAAHANTGVGVEQTRQYVRDTCAAWALPLIERHSPREQDSYRALVLRDGFPGPAWHARMYTRLKERALEQVRRELVGNPRRERIIYIAGRRRTESQRRANVPESERRGSTVWVSPLVNWTKLDMATYRLTSAADGNPVPVNEVSDLIHMSGECLCGAFASPGEREEIAFWFPGAFELIADLEALIADRTDIPEHRKTWGWGADPDLLAASREKPSTSGPLCSSCTDRFQPTLPVEVPA